MTGPPGCGKTTLVKALASMSNISFLSASASQLYSPYVGESEKKMTAVSFCLKFYCFNFILVMEKVVGLVRSSTEVLAIKQAILLNIYHNNEHNMPMSS